MWYDKAVEYYFSGIWLKYILFIIFGYWLRGGC